MPAPYDHLPEHLAARGAKTGEIRNPTGYSGSPIVRLSNREFKFYIRERLEQSCDRPGFEHLTWKEAIANNVLNRALDGEPWAVRELWTRAYGRVPYQFAGLVASMQMNDDENPDRELSIEELEEKARRLLGEIRAAEDARGAAVIDVEPTKP